MRDGDKRRKNTQTNPHNAMGKGMTKEQEAQQAQGIEIIREIQKQRARWRYTKTMPVQHIDILLGIVDYKAQKIKAMEANYRELAGAWFDEKEALEIQIAEQAKEIERLKKEHSEFLAGIGFQP